MNDLVEYVRSHTDRGECNCGSCFDRGTNPDPTGHVADVVFFKVAAVGTPDAETFRRLTAEQPGEFGAVDPFDGREHNYLELGAWIGDQGLAMQYMALGALLGQFQLMTPYTILGLQPGDTLAMQLAGAGYLAVQAAR